MPSVPGRRSGGTERGFGVDGPLIGRDAELASTLALLMDPEVRLVTLGGRGGVGKTRLAGEVARRLLGFEIPVTVVLLDSVTHADLVGPEIAARLELPPSATEPWAAVAARLADDRHVLVLDNLEHLLDVTPEVGRLLDACGGLQIVATSQAPLRLRRERVVVLEPFGLPPTADDTSLRALAGEAAIAIYCRAATAADSRFELTEANVEAVAELCRRAEGLPLALELAGARAATLGAESILRHWDALEYDAFSLERGDVPARHHDLRSAIAWTYDLLSPSQQELLGVLSVIAGSFDTAHVLSVTSTATADTIGDFSELHRFQLVEQVPMVRGSRFEIAQSIRSFVTDRLVTDGRFDDALRTAVRAWAQRANHHARAGEADRSESGRAFEDDHAGLQAALVVALECAMADEAVGLARALASRWDVLGYPAVFERLLEDALALGERAGADQIGLACTAVWSARLGLRHPSITSRAVLLERLLLAESTIRSRGDAHSLLHLLVTRMLLTPAGGDVAQALAAADEALDLVECEANVAWRPSVRVWVGMLRSATGRHDDALELGAMALADARRGGDDEGIVRAMMLLGPLADRWTDELGPPLPTDVETVEICRRIDQPFWEAVLLARLLGRAAAAGDVDHALAWAEEALVMARSMTESPLVSFHLLGVALTAVAAHDLPVAARFYGTVRDSIADQHGYLVPEQRRSVEATIGGVRRELGDERFEAEAARGALLSRDEAVAAAIQYIRQRSAPVGRDVQSDGPTRLTPRQREVLVLLAQGRTNKEIAVQLGVTAKTVMHHTTAIYRTLGVRSRGEAAAWAYRAGVARVS
jgi:predicted ATPase/DNA-binding CsgD family transcriptional regulator